MTQRAAVIGAGISGLTAAFELQNAGFEVQVFEASARVGGIIATSTKEGCVFECGPNSFPSSADALLSLSAKIGIEERLIEANRAASKRLIYNRQTLQEVPSGPLELILSPMFTLSQKLRIFAEPLVRRGDPSKPESVAKFFSRRFGLAPTQTLVDAFVSGIYAGDPRQMGLRSAFPRLFEWEQQYGSLLKALKANKGRNKPMSLYSYRDGMQELPQALARKLKNSPQLNCRVEKLTKLPSGQFELKTKTGDQIDMARADKVVLALPAMGAGFLMTEINPMVSDLLFDISYASVMTVHLGFPETEFPKLPEAFGFLVPRQSRLRTLGWLFNSRVFEGRAPEGQVAMTAYLGGAGDQAITASEDDAVRHLILGELSLALRMHRIPQPNFYQVLRHDPGLPQLDLGHHKRVHALNILFEDHPDMALVGNYMGGVSLNDCVKTANRTVERLIRHQTQTEEAS